MSKKNIIIIIVIIIITVILILAFGREDNKLTVPGFIKSQVTPIPGSNNVTPNVTPKNFKFDRSTDLKKELEKVDSKVLEEDFYE